MDLQQDTFNWIENAESCYHDNSYSSALFDTSFNFDNMSPAFTWDRKYIDPLPYYSSPQPILSDTVSSLSITVECPDHDDFQATTVFKPEDSSTLSSRSTSPEVIASMVKPQKARRGRPRLNSTTSSKPATNVRVPHKEVERKYRDGLNTIMERLRMSVPSTARWEGDCSDPFNLKPSKAMVLASAIDYIKAVEEERDMLVLEIESIMQ
jgi:hypothetical protein